MSVETGRNKKKHGSHVSFEKHQPSETGWCQYRQWGRTGGFIMASHKLSTVNGRFLSHLYPCLDWLNKLYNANWTVSILMGTIFFETECTLKLFSCENSFMDLIEIFGTHPAPDSELVWSIVYSHESHKTQGIKLERARRYTECRL